MSGGTVISASKSEHRGHHRGRERDWLFGDEWAEDHHDDCRQAYLCSRDSDRGEPSGER